MLTDEQAQEIFANEHCNISKELAGILARAIEAAVLPEGLVAVPKEPSDELLIEMNRHYSMRHAYQAMIAFVLKAQAEKQGPFPFSADRVTYHKTVAIGAIMPCGTMVTNVKEAYEAGQKAQVSPLDLMECLQDRPVEPSKAKLPKGCHRSHPHEDMNEECQRKTVEAMVANLAAQADKQEPVVRLHITQTGSYPDVQVEVLNGEGFSENGSILLYTRPQPDLTAEVEFMQGKYEEMLAEWLPQKQRIAALEEAAREARDALQYKLHVVEAIAKLDAVLGNA